MRNNGILLPLEFDKFYFVFCHIVYNFQNFQLVTKILNFISIEVPPKSLHVNHTYIKTSLTFLVSKMGLTSVAAQPASILRAKFWKAVVKCKHVIFFKFWALFSKCTFLRLQHFFTASTFPLNSIFSVVVRIIVDLLTKHFSSFQLLS